MHCESHLQLQVQYAERTNDSYLFVITICAIPFLLLRLVVQCKYTASSVEALVVEVVSPLLTDVAAEGPLHVELRLASGKCDVKGCNKG